MAEETTPNPESQPSDSEAKATPAKAPAKKEKPPAIEEKPFTEFMEQHFTPALQKGLTQQGLTDVMLSLTREKVAIPGANSDEPCWQLSGQWKNGQRQFKLYFLEENINGQKAFSYAANGNSHSTIESFMIDERKTTLDLMVLYTLQRLNGQKWLTRN